MFINKRHSKIFMGKEVVFYVFLVLSIILVPVSFAEELFDDYVYNGDTVSADEFIVSSLLTSSKAQIKVGDETLLLNYASCAKSSWFELCIGDYYPDSCAAGVPNDLDCRLGSRQISGGVPATKIAITSFEPKLSISQTSTTGKQFVDREYTITSTITNDGDVELTNIEFIEDFPSDVKLVSASVGEIVGNKLIYTKNTLAVDGEVEIEYTYKSTIPFETNQKALVRYSYSGKDFEVQSKGVKVDMQSPVTLAVEYKAAELKKSFGNFTLTNIHDRSVDVAINITFPSEIVLYPQGDVSEEDAAQDMLRWEGKLDEGDETILEFAFLAPRGEKYALPVEYTVAGKKLTTLLEIDVDRNSSASVLSFSMSPERSLLSGTALELVFFQKVNYDISDLQLNISSPLFDTIFINESSLTSRGNTEFYRVDVQLPNVSESTKYPVNISGNYFADKRLTFSTELDVHIVPEHEAVALKTEVDFVRDNIYVVKSFLDSKHPIHVRDIFVQHRLDGTTFSDKQFYSTYVDFFDEYEGEREVLSYQVRMPYSVEKKEIQTFLWVGNTVVEATEQIPALTQSDLPLEVLLTADQTVSLTTFELSVRNTGSQTLQNVFIDARFAPQIEVDRYPTFRISQLEPGEKVVYTFAGRLNDQSSELGTLLTFYEGSDGRTFFAKKEFAQYLDAQKGIRTSIDLFLDNLTAVFYFDNTLDGERNLTFDSQNLSVIVPVGFSSKTIEIPRAQLTQFYARSILGQYQDGHFSYLGQGKLLANIVSQELLEETANQTAQEITSNQKPTKVIIGENESPIDSVQIFIIGTVIILVIGGGAMLHLRKKVQGI